MQNIEEQILSYPHLSAEKQREVEAYVEAHPEWAPLLRDVRSLESFVRTADAGSSPEAFLTTYVVVQHLHPEEASTALQDAFRRLEGKMEDDSALRERAEAARRRLEKAEAEIDPVGHFEELTGHSLSTDTEERSSSAESTAEIREPAQGHDTTGSLRSFVDDLLRLPLAVQWAGAAVALLLGTYGILFATSEASRSTLDRLAAVDVSNQIVNNYTSTTTRSATPSNDSATADQLYVDALTAVQAARTSTLGLFPSYDTEALGRADQLLQQVLAQTESGSFLALEAHFYLGKVCLAQKQVEKARSHFKTVVEREGRMAEQARDILQTLQEQYPVEDASVEDANAG